MPTGSTEGIVMDAYLAPVFIAIAVSLALLVPIVLRRASQPGDRDAEWRDSAPAVLRLLRPVIRWYARGVDESMGSHKRDILQSRLNAAGATYLITPAEFLVVRRIAFAVGIAASLYAILLLDVSDPVYVSAAGSLAPFAYLYPDIWLRDSTRKRQARFAKEFPFFLDVLVLGMKAGLTFAAAIEQAADHLQDGPVRQEFARYLRETRTGVSRRAALDRLSTRVVIPAVANFSAAVAQAEETGGSLGEVLADQARQRRQERFLRAEKLANQAPVKMLFPLIALLFPVTFIIIGFPIVIQLVDSGAAGLLK
jgi:tight adherence protein C